jgi:heme/copper-type cytochrome/quinol oxidase subunit 4
MEDDAYIGGAIAGLLYLVAGTRLARLSVRTGEAPERLLGLTFLVWSFSYLFWQLAIALGNESLDTALFFISRLATVTGVFTLALFLRVVFRNQASWARWLVAVVALCSVVGIGGSLWVGDWESTRPLSNPWYWVEALSGITVTAWMGVEGVTQYFRARQRLQLGLCEPLVCNRYLLWSLVAASWMSLAVVVPINDITFELTGVWLATLDVLLGIFEFCGIALIWFVFFPPRFYQRWIEGSAGSARAGAG